MLKSSATKLIGNTVISQALLSGTSFIIAFVLLRRLGTEPYGYYVLISTGILLLTILQGAFFQTRLVAAIAVQKDSNLPELLGGLIKTRRRVIAGVIALLGALCLASGLVGLVELPIALLFLLGIGCGSAVLWREFTRSLLLALHKGGAALKGDAVYAGVLFCGSFTATFLPHPLLLAVCSIGLAGTLSSLLLTHYLWKFQPWSRNAKPTPLREISAIGGWAAFGSGVHWSFSQGYTYIVAALLNVNAVAAIAATRLLLMPVSLLSNGVTQALYPLVSRWNATHGVGLASRNVFKISVALMVGSLGYAGLAWLLQDWFFLTLMKHDVLLRSRLLLYWSLLVILMLLRDQVGCLLVVRLRVKVMGYITLGSAITSLIAIFALTRPLGPQGALLGVIVGEVLNIVGMLFILLQELRAADSTGTAVSPPASGSGDATGTGAGTTSELA